MLKIDIVIRGDSFSFETDRTETEVPVAAVVAQVDRFFEELKNPALIAARAGAATRLRDKSHALAAAVATAEADPPET